MRVKPSFLAIALALAIPAIAQPVDQADNTDCKAKEAALERDIDIARSKGQMLRRRQLAEALAALQTRCKAVAAPEQVAQRASRGWSKKSGNCGWNSTVQRSNCAS